MVHDLQRKEGINTAVRCVGCTVPLRRQESYLFAVVPVGQGGGCMVDKSGDVCEQELADVNMGQIKAGW